MIQPTLYRGRDSSIQWCDSSLNLQMGCDGCELWNSTKRTCYAGIQTQGRAGFKGWPKAFNEPELFLDRLAPALKWGDLSGTARDDKPWLDGLPRIIFLNDMGDTFSKKLPLFWLAPLLPMMAASPHQFLLLTKRPSRAIEFAMKHPFPDNFWLGTSVTSPATLQRIDQLRNIDGGRLKFVSFEPMLAEIPANAYEGIEWAIFGGESGEAAERTCMEWLLKGAEDARRAGARAFVKQLGARPYFYASIGDAFDTPVSVPFPIKDSHGGEWNEWPMNLRIREMPKIETTIQANLL